MVAPIMEVKNSGAEPPAAIHVASTRDALTQGFVAWLVYALASRLAQVTRWAQVFECAAVYYIYYILFTILYTILHTIYYTTYYILYWEPQAMISLQPSNSCDVGRQAPGITENINGPSKVDVANRVQSQHHVCLSMVQRFS